MNAKKSRYLAFATPALFGFFAQAALAAPYARIIGTPGAPTPSGMAGLLLDPKAIAGSEGVTNVNVVTHSTQDGSIIPQAWRSWLAPEDWVPLFIGGGGSFQGETVIDAGASANVAPQIAGLLADAHCSSETCLAIQSVLNSNYAKSGLGFAAGPAWALRVVNGGTFEPVDKWQGLFRINVSASYKF